MNSPYENLKKINLDMEDLYEYENTRERLLKEYPLSSDKIIKYCEQTLEIIKNIEINIIDDKIKLSDLELHGSAYGGLIDRILSNLIVKNELYWEKPTKKNQKDIVYKKNINYSVEIKSCGQKNTKVFGNASSNLYKKNKEEKSMDGYYITINYYKGDLYLIRFGWLDKEDWKSQDKGGQQARITDFAYQNKLKILYDDYILNTPLQLINRINIEKDFIEGDYRNELKQIYNLRNIIKYRGNNDKIIKMKYTFLTSSSVYLVGKTKVDLLEFLNRDNDEVKDVILEELLNIPICFLDIGKVRIRHNLLLKNIIDYENSSLNESEKILAHRIISSQKILLKNTCKFQGGTYKNCEFDINYYKNYNGESKLINKFKQILSDKVI